MGILSSRFGVDWTSIDRFTSSFWSEHYTTRSIKLRHCCTRSQYRYIIQRQRSYWNNTHDVIGILFISSALCGSVHQRLSQRVSVVDKKEDNCNLIPGVRPRVDRVRPWLWRIWPLHCFALLGDTIVTVTCWIRPARPLSTITLVTHLQGENHELDISYPNHELAITWICTTALGVTTSTRILGGSKDLLQDRLTIYESKSSITPIYTHSSYYAYLYLTSLLSQSSAELML